MRTAVYSSQFQIIKNSNDNAGKTYFQMSLITSSTLYNDILFLYIRINKIIYDINDCSLYFYYTNWLSNDC